MSAGEAHGGNANIADALGGAPSKRPDPLLGALINGKFKIERAIARGGMGRIYYGTQAPLDRPVALKVVKTEADTEEEAQFIKRFLLEASILAKLQHPNVVTLFDYGKIEKDKVEGLTAEQYFIAMEYLDGETLSERLRTCGALTAIETITLFRQIARGLREAHTRGIVHRDLKPSNIMLVPGTDGEIVKLVDFGIGKVERSGEDLTRDGVLVGTPKYMAPEQFNGECSPASDLYALGTIIYQCLAGTVPFEGSSVTDFMVAKLTRDFKPLREVNPIVDATESLEQLVYSMLARSPADRPTLDTAFDLLATCEEEIFGAGARLALSASGSRPSLGGRSSSRPMSVGALKVPYTVVAPAPLVPGLNPGGSNPISVLTGLTPRPISTSAFPSGATPAPRRSRKGLLLAALVLALLAVAGVLLVVRGRAPSPTATAVTPQPSAPSAPPTAPTSFVVTIESEPRGATVLEGDKDLGRTPLDLVIDLASVAGGPRTFAVTLPGHVTQRVTQGRADGHVTQKVTLATETGRAVNSAPPGHRGGGKAGATKPPAPSPGDSDIRLKR